MVILFFGDIMGKIGRKAVAKILPSWKKKYKPDLIAAKRAAGRPQDLIDADLLEKISSSNENK